MRISPEWVSAVAAVAAVVLSVTNMLTTHQGPAIPIVIADPQPNRLSSPAAAAGQDPLYVIDGKRLVPFDQGRHGSMDKSMTHAASIPDAWIASS
jgi:hypothetical protein